MSLDLSPALALLRRRIPGLAGVYLFGSHVAGPTRPDSDVDLAFYAGKPVSRAIVLDVQERVANALARDVDLIDLAAASTILQIQVIDEGRLIDAPDADATAMFEVRAIREYQDLKERRAATEADIVSRGRVYGR